MIVIDERDLENIISTTILKLQYRIPRLFQLDDGDISVMTSAIVFEINKISQPIGGQDEGKVNS